MTGSLLSADVPAPEVQVRTTGTGLDATIATHVNRSWRTTGVLHTSAGQVPVTSSGRWTFDNTTALSDSAAKQKTDQHVRGGYGSVGRFDGFDFSLNADVTQNIVDDSNYRIDAGVHMGRRLWTVGDQPALSDDSIDTSGGFGRTNGVLTYADGSSRERWNGLDDTGRSYFRNINTMHGYVTKNVSSR